MLVYLVFILDARLIEKIIILPDFIKNKILQELLLSQGKRYKNEIQVQNDTLSDTGIYFTKFYNDRAKRT